MNRTGTVRFVRYYSVLLIFLTVIFLSSCKNRQKVANAGPPPVPSQCEDPLALRDSLKKAQFQFEWISAKMKCDAKTDSGSFSFDVNLKMKKDSVIWMNITAIGGAIRVARVMITRDSVKFLNYREDPVKYFKGDFAYINKMLQTDLDFEMIQSMLVGNSVEFYEDTAKLRTFFDDGKCAMSTIRKRKLRRAEKNRDMKADSAQTIWLEPGTFKIARVLFNDFNTRRSFDAKYEDFQLPEDGNMLFPNTAKFTISAETNMSISVEYNKVSVNKSTTFPFNLPESYEPIQFKEKDR